MSTPSEHVGLEIPPAEDDASLADSAWELIRLRANQSSADPGMLNGLGGLQDAARLVCTWLVRAARLSSNPDNYLLEALPVLWWLHFQTGVDVLIPLACDIDPTRSSELAHAATHLIAELDKGDNPPAWHTAADRIPMLTELEAEVPEKAHVLARGVALTMRLTGGTITPTLQYIRHHASTDLCRALTTEPMLVDNVPWLSALILRGDERTRALAACSLANCSNHTHVSLQSFIVVLPEADLVAIAEVHGLLGLIGEDETVRNVIRTALLTRIWQGDSLSGLAWWDAFRGEDCIARILPECGDARVALAKNLLDGLPTHALAGGALTDAPTTDALVSALVTVLTNHSSYDSPLRRAEAALRDRIRLARDPSIGRALRGYATVVMSAARQLLANGHRHPAQALYTRVLSLRRSYPLALPRGLFPDDLVDAGDGNDAAAVRRWSLRRKPSVAAGGPTRQASQVSADDPLPDAREVVASVGSLQPLPKAIGRWAGAARLTTLGMLSLVVPVPIRYLWMRLARLIGSTPTANFLLSDEGHGAVCTEHRIAGVIVKRRHRNVAGGRLFLFPVENPAADRMLGRWAALLLLFGTIGTWLALRSSDTAGTAIAVTFVATIILTYLGAAALHRRIAHGLAVAVIDSDNRLSVWSIDPETRYLLERYVDRSQRPGIADIAARPRGDAEHESNDAGV
ncbi:MAG: hypothetical protein VX223_08460 [Myxococcota bacterium]|nr:hypothetical protein [Myxococcota bacterium]